MDASNLPALQRLYRIPVEWIAFGTIEIEAASLEEACQQAVYQTFSVVPGEGEDVAIRYHVMQENLKSIKIASETPADYPPGFPLSEADKAWLRQQ